MTAGRDASAAPGDMPEPQRLQTRCGALEYVVSGAGEPGIVLFNGAGAALAGWRALYPRIESLGTVLAWNRFGMEGSDTLERVQSGALVVAAVRELMSYAGVKPPVVLVGHSLGGLYANLFARLHPGEVAGVLFLEATHPADHEVLRMDEAQLAKALRKVTSVPAWVFRDNLHAEVEAVGHVVEEVDAAGPFPPVPVAVITGGLHPPGAIMDEAALEARLAHQRELARMSPQGEHIVADRSGHFPQVSQPDAVIHALEELVSRAGLSCRT